MTDDDDDEDDEDAASGIPVRVERPDSGAHGTSESGRHVTNRNVVPRGGVPLERIVHEGTAGRRDRRGRAHDDFEVVTPVLPQPRDVFVDEEATLSHDDELDAASPSAPAWQSATPADRAAVSGRSEAIMARVRERLPRITPSPLGALPQESRRASTEPGHVEPRRRPTTPPPRLRPPGALAEPLAYEPDIGDADRTPTAPGHVAHTPAADAGAALDRALRIVAVLAVLGLGAAGLAQPSSVLRGGIAWLGFLLFALTGWGAIVARIARAGDPDVGLRAALGAAGYVAIAGVTLAFGVLTRPVILALIGAGFAGFAWRELTAPVAIWQRVRDGLVFVRTHPALGVFVIAIALLACVRMLGAVAALEHSPDDDIAYTPFVKRLLDAGDLIEPFSFHRLGAYGGQTVLQALGAARGTLANVHLVDHGLGFGIALLAMVGYARERRTEPLWLALIALVVVVLPDTAITTASYWTGVLAFLALYRCVVREQWSLVGLTAAMTCALRQSYLVPVAVFLACVALSRLVTLARTMPLRQAWRQDRGAWTSVVGVALAVIVPWWIAAHLSSHTFLFPIVDGTWNHELSLRPSVTSWPQELASVIACCLESSPIVVIPILAFVFAFVTDRRLGRPLPSLLIASVLGLVALVHGLLGSDPLDLWRHAFGFATALAIAMALELGAGDDAGIVITPLGRWIALVALVLQIAIGRGALPGQALALFDDIGEAAAIDRRADPGVRAMQRRTAAMQAALPAGARAIAMLDEPGLLDYRRNVFANLDTPGRASPGPQLPAFHGAEPLRAYLVAQGYRYAAFVRSERSRSWLRRGLWIERMFADAERVQTTSAYMIDAIDNFAELATTTRVLHDDDGLVVLDLATPLREASQRVAPGDEPARRGSWVRALADREGLHDAWSLTTRADLRFEAGTEALRTSDGRFGTAKHGTVIRPLARRVHLRVRGASDMRLTLRAAIVLDAVDSYPRLDVSLDGDLLVSAVANAAGHYAVDVMVAKGRLAGGWHDLYLVFGSVADPGRSVGDPSIARLESVEWSAP